MVGVTATARTAFSLICSKIDVPHYIDIVGAVDSLPAAPPCRDRRGVFRRLEPRLCENSEQNSRRYALFSFDPERLAAADTTPVTSKTNPTAFSGQPTLPASLPTVAHRPAPGICEHVIDASAALAEEVFQAAAGVHVLASREPLRARGERVVRLSPLEAPDRNPALTAAEALAFPAIQLFVEHAVATLDAFELTETEAPTVADICRRLDGNALAIELAADCIDVFGVSGLAANLDDRLGILTRGRRTALPRHE
jgi:hypothetical protein